MQSRVLHGALVLAGLLAVTPAYAQYAHVQIEMVIGSVDGDPSLQGSSCGSEKRATMRSRA